MAAKVTKLNTDVDIANKIRTKVEELVFLMNEAKRRGMNVGFGINPVGPNGDFLAVTTIQRVTDI